MTIVPFDASDRILVQAKTCLASPERVIKERERYVPLLLKALRLSRDLNLRRDILLLLGSFAKEDLYWPLYEIMSDPQEPDEFRDQAAIHLSVMGAFLDDPQALIRRLINDIETGGHDSRVRAIIAIGWEGNLAAVLPLIECLYDADQEIQEVAVNALCNLKDSRVVSLLAERLKNGSIDQKRAILFNLWRFKDRQDEVAAIYKKEIESGDPDLRLEILALLDRIDGQNDHADLYKSLLLDPDDKVRNIALERLGALKKITPGDALQFLSDPSMMVKRTATKILQLYGKPPCNIH
ncbi:MAG: HEAT repeat domain-containing protein [Dissulfurimicrobium sp.]|uniref:HEAT repeat domain-containing protein n=1 Tax=Dissulfurimicrobium TaxID=1769732 RepID=UPI003C785824